MSTTTPHLLRVPLAHEAAEHLSAFTTPELGPSLRLAHLGALHGYLIAAGAIPRTLSDIGDPLGDARAHLVGGRIIPDDLDPDAIALTYTASDPFLPDGALYLADLIVEPVYLAGVLFGYAQATSEWPDAAACGACHRRVTDADDSNDTCPYTREMYCDATEHHQHCPNPADCFADGDLTNDLWSDR